MALLEQLENRQISKAQLLKLAENDFTLVPTLIEGTLSQKATVRYSCSSVLMDLSETYPDQLYPYFDSFVTLLESKFRPLSWGALAILANLTSVDNEKRFDAIFDKYYSNLGSEYMVTVANTVADSSTIVSNKPYLADRVAVEVLKVQNLRLTPHLTEECTRVIAGQAIETFGVLMKYTKYKAALVAFAQKHQDSSRASLRREAQAFLKKWQ